MAHIDDEVDHRLGVGSQSPVASRRCPKRAIADRAHRTLSSGERLPWRAASQLIPTGGRPRRRPLTKGSSGGSGRFVRSSRMPIGERTRQRWPGLSHAHERSRLRRRTVSEQHDWADEAALEAVRRSLTTDGRTRPAARTACRPVGAHRRTLGLRPGIGARCERADSPTISTHPQSKPRCTTRAFSLLAIRPLSHVRSERAA
jgi:hypothetical protein